MISVRILFPVGVIMSACGCYMWNLLYLHGFVRFSGGFLPHYLYCMWGFMVYDMVFEIDPVDPIILFTVFRLYRKKQESLPFIRVPASVLLFSSQYGIHLDDQFQDTAEFHLLMSFFPCKDALPGGILAVFDKDVEGGTDAVLFHQLLIFHTFFM